MKPSRSAGREAVRHRSVLPRFWDAFHGLLTTYREEPNFRFHVFAASGVILGGLAVKLDGWEAGYLALTITLVLFAEAVNTAVERVVDFAAAGRRHPLAGAAKEVAAGAVLLTASHAALAALYIFAVRRGAVETVQALWNLVLSRPGLLLLPVLTGWLGIYGGQSDD